MSWAFAIFAMFSMLVLSIFTFLLIIYFKEFAKENKILDNLAKMPILDLGSLPLYAPSKKAKSGTIKTEEEPTQSDKNKKGWN
jgi:hypothetical protein